MYATYLEVNIYNLLFFSQAVAVTLNTFTPTHWFTGYTNTRLTFVTYYWTMDFQEQYCCVGL